MQSNQGNQSEIARLKERIRLEYDAGKAAMQGLSQGASTHWFIVNRTERMAVAIAELIALAGEEAALEAYNAL